MGVEVVFIRHGLACHNALNYQTAGFATSGGRFNHCRYPDPPLTDCGVAQSTANGVALLDALETKLSWKPQSVYSSSMIRAMETAMAMFPGHTVAPLPFINERGTTFAGFGQCNTPIALSDQENYMKGKPIDWQHVNHTFSLTEAGIAKRASDPEVGTFSETQTTWTSEDARKRPWYKGFRAFLGEQVVPGLIATAGKGKKEDKDEKGKEKDTERDEDKQNDVVRIAIVSHSKFLKTKVAKKYFQCDANNRYFVNNDAMLVHYDFDPETRVLTE